ncbi:TolC family protein [Longimicrobium sp.]|uniref:TolC family protein n=1 Tax=Longimicrobium sp. TaxID=2029185 RepID=UPI002E313AA7|nr:TolC family protein [Longimicrobium sp.]HEX6037238.1 TolC family protein [Longimicrobium sp.]
MKQMDLRVAHWTRVGIVAAALMIAPAAAAQTTPQGAASAQTQTASVPETQPARAVTLRQAVQMAHESNPSVVSATGAITTAQAAERSARGAYLPSLSVNAGTSLAGTSTIGTPAAGTALGGTSDAYSAGLSASWDVYTGGRRGAERDAAQAETRASQADLTAQRASVSLDVERAFYEVLRTEDLAAVAQSRIQRAEEGVTAAQQRLQLGSATRSDLLRAQLELNTARGDLLQARTERDAAQLALGRLVGADDAVTAARGDESRVDAVSDAEASALLASIQSEAPAVIAARAATESASAGVDAARSQYLPSVSVSTGYNWQNSDPVFDQSRTNWSVGIGVSYPIFNGYQREESVVRARAQQTTSQAQLADAVRGVRTDAARALGQLRLAQERIALAEQALTTAQEDLRVQRERYRLGSTTILELLTSQEALVQAETDVVTSRYDYQVARAELQALAGRSL